MKRKGLIVLLATTSVLGFAAGAVHLHHGCGWHQRGGWHGAHRGFEEHVSQLCAAAAMDVFQAEGKSDEAP